MSNQKSPPKENSQKVSKDKKQSHNMEDSLSYIEYLQAKQEQKKSKLNENFSVKNFVLK